MTAVCEVLHDALVTSSRGVRSDADLRSEQPYKAFLEVGAPAVPFLVERLKRYAWVGYMVLLRDILGDGPPIPEGKVEAATGAWLTWLEQHTKP